MRKGEWITKTGKVLKIKEMSVRHIRSVINMLNGMLYDIETGEIPVICACRPSHYSVFNKRNELMNALRGKV